MPAMRELLEAMFQAAVASADPEHCLAQFLPAPPIGRTIVVGAGKASAEMAKAVESHWPGAIDGIVVTPIDGIVVTPYGHAIPCAHIEVLEAAHPIPDAAGLAAAERILEAVTGLTANDLVLVLLSGGGSALLTLPAPGLDLSDKIEINRALLASGAPISKINCVRKHLSAIKGGRLAAAAAPARVHTLAISDVPGDEAAVIASGPTVADPTMRDDAIAILHRYEIMPPERVQRHLGSENAETPNPGDPVFDGNETHIIAAPGTALAAAAAVGRAAGYGVEILGDAVEGEAREIGRDHARLARDLAPKSILLSGGELTVTVEGSGRGGPNSEYLLALTLALGGEPGIHALACDTDGIDGGGGNAGAYTAPETLARAQGSGLDGHAQLANNDAYNFFAPLGGLIHTGPTRTNVNDFRAILRE